MPTGFTIVQDALTEIGVRGLSETLSADEATDGLSRLNRMVDHWRAQNLTLSTIERTTAAMTANQAQFTVGPTTGDILMARRPEFIERINFLDTSLTPDAEFPLPMMTEDQWESITLKDQTSTYPQAVYWNPTFPLGELNPWPIPTSATLRWVIYRWEDLAPFTLTTDVDLPPSYQEAITQNLALLLCPQYERQPHPVLVKSASESLATLKRGNQRVREIKFGADVLGDRSNYYPGPGAWWIYSGP